MNFRSTSEDFLDSAELLPYPMSTNSAEGGESLNAPVSICFTEFHFVYLYPDKVISVGILDHRQDYEEKLALVCSLIDVVISFLIRCRKQEKRLWDL